MFASSFFFLMWSFYPNLISRFMLRYFESHCDISVNSFILEIVIISTEANSFALDTKPFCSDKSQILSYSSFVYDYRGGTFFLNVLFSWFCLFSFGKFTGVRVFFLLFLYLIQSISFSNQSFFIRIIRVIDLHFSLRN